MGYFTRLKDKFRILKWCWRQICKLSSIKYSLWTSIDVGRYWPLVFLLCRMREDGSSGRQQGEEEWGCGVAQLCVCHGSSIPGETHFFGSQTEEVAWWCFGRWEQRCTALLPQGLSWVSELWLLAGTHWGEGGRKSQAPYWFPFFSATHPQH